MSTVLDLVRQRRTEARSQLDVLAAPAEQGGRNLSPSEATAFDAKVAEVRAFDARITELEAEERRAAASAETRRLSGDTGQPMGGFVASGGETYQKGDRSRSFFKDLRASRLGDGEAIARLQANQAEARALGNTGGVLGSGGEAAPPGWFIQEFIALARAGRVTANLVNRQPLPAGVSSVILPKITGGSVAAIQTTQNTALSQVDITTGSVASNIYTLGGKQVVSLQLVEQSGLPFDQLVLADLAADTARAVDTAVISGAGGSSPRGLLSVAGTNVAWNQTTPAAVGAGGLYSKLAQLAQAVQTSRYLPITAWLMHPRRWLWLSTAFDSQSRPLVVPSGGGTNVIASMTDNAAQGNVGSLFGIPVYVDPNIPTNLTGTGTNTTGGSQDIIVGFRPEDVYLFESDIVAQAFDQPYADSLGILLRTYEYSASVPDRFAAGIGTITGSGLAAPTWV